MIPAEHNNDLLRLETWLLSFTLTLTFIVMLGACLCCKKKLPKNDLLGLEGMVKLTNPDEVILVNSNNATGNTLVRNSESQASTVSNADSEKRSSTAAHRSLPDIPVADSNDNGSELYETVADKQLVDARQSPQPNLKKQTSVSQHSSISQADDVSSPYSRVKGVPHDYAKVRTTEHPYAQLNAPSSSVSATINGPSVSTASTSYTAQHGADDLQRGSQHSEGSTQHLNEPASSQSEIPAASAIAGMISASQDLPYMTPPIANQHFSGDSQDSSKGYTSISVREPLANILAQHPNKPSQRNPSLLREGNDSHYATVSDDSDETYAAIEDPNNRHMQHTTDIYTSGSETYAQIQPMQPNPIVVAVEINNSSSGVQLPGGPAGISSAAANNSVSGRPNSTNTDYATPVPPPVDTLRAQMHSRQASCSSNHSSSVCNLGSPKPEKRQANSPLPPTPKASTNQGHQMHATSSSTLASGRNSVISVIEAGAIVDTNEAEPEAASPQRQHSKSLSPSKDIEGMYAKVMKKHKFSRHSPSSQNSSPIMTRKEQLQEQLAFNPLDSTAANQMIEVKNRGRSNSYSAKDHGYETIPADGLNTQVSGFENRKSDCYAASMLQKERQLETVAHINVTPALANHISATQVGHNINSNSNDDDDAKKSDYDPNYEVLKSRAHSDDGYAKVLEKNRTTGGGGVGDAVDGSGGYSTIPGADANHNYASILETKASINNSEIDHYARISEPGKEIPNSVATTPHSTGSLLASPTTSFNITTTATSSTSMSSRQTPLSSQYESLTGSETDPNYESVCYLNTTTTTSSAGTEPAYERLHNELSGSTTQANSPLTPEATTTTTNSIHLTGSGGGGGGTTTELLVDDYFQV